MKYSRVLIKLSGEFLGENGNGFSAEAARDTARKLAGVISQTQAAVLVGGGNIMRARAAKGLGRLNADYMGMTATLLNAIGLKDAFDSIGIDSKVLSSLDLRGITDPFNAVRARALLQEGSTLILAGGTGSPFFTTDTAAALRALEINADALLKATKVDGAYDKDPEKDSQARLIKGLISIEEAISKNLEVMDISAFSLLKGKGIDIVIFNFRQEGSLKKAVRGEAVGTVLR
ncbi:MAG: uridine monophosphate kinase [Elusimicrobiota bacterium]